jgi:hypothetical protein
MSIENTKKAAESETAETSVITEVKESSVDTFTCKLTKPFSWMDKTYDELHFDFSTLGGEDAVNIMAAIQALGKSAAFPVWSMDYQYHLAAKANSEKLGADAILKLPLKDFNRITTAARNFLMV